MTISQTAETMAAKVLERLIPPDAESAPGEINETRTYYEVLAQTFLDAKEIYDQGITQYVNYQEQAIQGMANSVYEFMRGRYFPNIVMPENDVAGAKKSYEILARGFLEGISESSPEAAGMADRVCAYIRQWYYPNVNVDDSETRAYHTVLAQGFLDGRAAFMIRGA